jgi:DNA uptake protein ComE-like DNA-binding protein
MNIRLLATLVSFVFAGCAMSADPEAVSSAYALSLSTTNAALILDFVNYPGTDLDTLDRLVGLDARAAQNIVAWRNGADGLAPSSDDDLFADIAELDAIPYVGDVAFQKLQAYAALHPTPSAESVEGVYFRGWESEAVVSFVDSASLDVLDGILDARAAQALIAARPFTSVTAMGPVAYVGASALERLRTLAPSFWSAMHASGPSLAGVYDGVAFDETSAAVALEIANVALAPQLEQHTILPAIAELIVAHRPYATLADVAAVDGVGSVTIARLRTYAQSGQWVPPVTGFVLDAAALADIVTRQKESLYEDEGFAEVVLSLAGNDDLATRIMQALEAQIDLLSAPLLGGVYPDADSAYDAVYEAAPVKQLVRDGGWTYLESIGVTR